MRRCRNRARLSPPWARHTPKQEKEEEKKTNPKAAYSPGRAELLGHLKSPRTEMRRECDWSLAPQKQLCFRNAVRFLPAPEPARSVQSRGQAQPGVRGFWSTRLTRTLLRHRRGSPEGGSGCPALSGELNCGSVVLWVRSIEFQIRAPGSLILRFFIIGLTAVSKGIITFSGNLFNRKNGLKRDFSIDHRHRQREQKRTHRHGGYCLKVFWHPRGIGRGCSSNRAPSSGL